MQKRSEETRARIRNAALELFSQSGYEATGVAEICQAANVSKGAFYHHFPSKQAIFLDLLHQWLTALDAQLEAAQSQMPYVPQALMHMASLMQVIFEQARGHLPMFLEFWTQAIRDQTIWQTLIAPYRRYQAFFAQMIQLGIDQGSIAPISPELAAHLIVSTAVGLLLQSVIEPSDKDWGLIAEQSFEILLKGMVKETQ